MIPYYRLHGVSNWRLGVDNELKVAIDVLVARIEKKLSEVAALKGMVNGLCVEAGSDPIYSDSATAYSTATTIRPDQFYGKSPIVAAREYLEMKGRAVSLDEILEALNKGGFNFKAVGWTEPLRLKNLGISLGKNSSIFHRLPNDTVGLVKFYPEVERKLKQRKVKANGQASDEPETEVTRTEAASN